MNSAELRQLQSTFKERYRNSPTEAAGTLIARGKVDIPSLTCQLEQPGPPRNSTGLHPATGGDGKTACAAEMLLEALIGCAGVTFAAVCTAMDLSIRSATLQAEGDLDFRGTLGVSREVPIGFQAVRLIFEINSPEADDKLTRAVQLAERYCVVAQTLKAVSVQWHRVPVST